MDPIHLSQDVIVKNFQIIAENDPSNLKVEGSGRLSVIKGVQDKEKVQNVVQETLKKAQEMNLCAYIEEEGKLFSVTTGRLVEKVQSIFNKVHVDAPQMKSEKVEVVLFEFKGERFYLQKEGIASDGLIHNMCADIKDDPKQPVSLDGFQILFEKFSAQEVREAMNFLQEMNQFLKTHDNKLDFNMLIENPGINKLLVALVVADALGFDKFINALFENINYPDLIYLVNNFPEVLNYSPIRSNLEKNLDTLKYYSDENSYEMVGQIFVEKGFLSGADLSVIIRESRGAYANYRSFIGENSV